MSAVGQAGAGEQVQADRADTRRVQAVEFPAARVLLDAGDTPAVGTGRAQHIEQQAVVGAVVRRLDQHRAPDAELSGQGLILLQRAVREGVERLRHMRVAGLEDMEVRVAAVRRDREARPRVGLGGAHGRRLKGR
ncbi:hypothetical protein ACGFMO_34890 [Streptomyces niveus]|uniref:hypothetical protein n=1 Tax=Streptomyces niveus TaxID=193462 RepID=UPI0037134E5D